MLTFGVEFECVAALTQEESQSDRTALEAIASSIRELGLLANVFLLRSTRDQPDYNVWNICLDVTILEETSSAGSPREGCEDLQLVGAEIVSPIFESDSKWQLTLEKVFSSSGLGARIPITTNRSTGFHVHVGTKDGSIKEFTLQQVKSVAMAVMFFEEVIDQYHHASRSVLIEHEDLAPNWRNNRLRDCTDARVIEMIFAAETLMEVIAIVCYNDQTDYTGHSDSKFFKVNFTSLSKCGTIEFRQHIATTDVTRLSRWIRFVNLFVEIALITPQAVWESYLPTEKNSDLLFGKFLGNLELQKEFE